MYSLVFTPVGQKWPKKLSKYLRVLKSFINMQQKVTIKTTIKTVAIGKVTSLKQFINLL